MVLNTHLGLSVDPFPAIRVSSRRRSARLEQQQHGLLQKNDRLRSRSSDLVVVDLSAGSRACCEEANEKAHRIAACMNKSAETNTRISALSNRPTRTNYTVAVAWA